jgi:hypothetical protein
VIAPVLAILAAVAAIDQSKRKTTARKSARRQPRTSSEDLRRLADLIVLLDSRRERRRELAEKLEALRRGALMTIVGEEALLTAIDAHLTNASRIVGELDGDDAAIEDRMTALETALRGYEWEVVEQTLPLLDDKRITQDEVIREHQADVNTWKRRLEPLRNELELARPANAPVTRERAELKRLDGLVVQAERALLDQRYPALAEPLKELSAAGDPSELAAQVREKRERAQRFGRQADVMLLHALGERPGTLKYTVLLRPPGERTSHGIHIQDSSDPTNRDRDDIRADIGRVTQAINDGIQRSFRLRGSEAVAEPQDAVTPVPEGVETPATPASDTQREWRPESEQPARDPEAPLPQDSRALVTDVGNVMFRLFVPDRMWQYLSTTPCALTITTNDLELPWELMYDSSWEESESEVGLGFLCLQRPIARMPMGRAFPRAIRKPVQRGAKLRFLLVHSDPDTNLPAAGTEVAQIERALGQHWSDDRIDITVLGPEEATVKQLTRALLTGNYDVIHYAGHAHFDADDPELSGLLMHEREVFISQRIRRFVEGNPLVFLNACETGVTANEDAPQNVGEYFWRPAEGLASAFLYGGALGCVGSLWPIYDGPAADFAIAFYNQVLEGQAIGEAMRLTRRSIKEKHPESLTWASFVLYGDPTFQLVE